MGFLDFYRCCSQSFNSVIEARKHDLAYHYDYVLGQHSGNRELVRKWASENDE